MTAQLAQVAGRYDEAIDQWSYVSWSRVATIVASKELARAHDVAGRTRTRIEWYRRELEVARTTPPDRPILFERLGQLYDETGDLENAAVYYARFVELWADADAELQPRVQSPGHALKRS